MAIRSSFYDLPTAGAHQMVQRFSKAVLLLRFLGVIPLDAEGIVPMFAEWACAKSD